MAGIRERFGRPLRLGLICGGPDSWIGRMHRGAGCGKGMCGGVALRLTREVVFFESLFKGSKWTWVFGWLFHASLLLVLLRHLRYFQQPVWAPIVFVQFFGTWAGVTMVAGLAGLWARRFLVDRVRYISTPSDHLHLALLIVGSNPADGVGAEP